MAYKQRWVAFLTRRRIAPLVCGRVAALVANELRQCSATDTYYRLQIYVDDPCVCASGSGQLRDFNMAATVLLWHT